VKKAFDMIRNGNVSEYEVQQFILEEFKRNNLVGTKDLPIVAFNESAANPHYCPKKEDSKKIVSGIVMIDVWAKLNEEDAPYADITLMGSRGEISQEMKDAFFDVIKARDDCLNFIRMNLLENGEVIGKDCHDIVFNFLEEKHKGKFIHSTGHSLSWDDVHGYYPYLNSKSLMPLLKNVGYTIEPGLYFKEKFGVRSEIDFYITNRNELIVTTEMQKDFVKL
jgi:Xaa-Pro aminopeptidase